MNEAKTEKRINEKTGRLAQHYLCAACCQEYTAKDVVVDHIDPVIHPKEGFVSWDVFIQRLYCDKDNLSVLCKVCHKIKSKEENEIRLHEMRKRKNSGGNVER